MALGDSNLKQVEAENALIKSTINFGNEEDRGLYSCWNTFQYVTKNLSLWADETKIGAETREQMLKLTNNLYDLMNATVSLQTKIDNFVNGQRSLNAGSNSSRKRRAQPDGNTYY